jgi:serine/threonine protein kinase
MSGEILARQAAMTEPTPISVAMTERRPADAAALTEALVERAAKDDRKARASIDALTRLLVHTLDEAVPGKEAPARVIARTVAESFVSGETLEMALLRATATADTLSLSEPETRQVQRAITESLTSTDVLARLVSPVTEGSALSEAALASVVRTGAASPTSEAPRAGILRAAPAVSATKRDVVVAELAISGRYRVIETLIPGLEDALYLARCQGTGGLVELQVLAGGLGADDELVHVLSQHVAKVAGVSGHCRAIATVYECERAASGALVIVMEHPEGPTLRDAIRQEGGLDVARALGVAIQIAKALERAHCLGLVHGGLCPENIVLVGPEQTIALTHVGFDRVLASRPPVARDRTVAHSSDSAYRAPEQASGHVSEQSDVFALGAVLYEMLTGSTPFDGASSDRRVDAQPLRERRPELTPSLERVVMRMLQETPHRRPAGISVVCDELRLELSPDGQRKPSYRRTVAGARAGKRRKHILAWAAFAALTPLAIWFALPRMTSDTLAAPNLPLLSPPTAAAPLAAPRPNAPAANRAKAAPSGSSLAPSARKAPPPEGPSEVRDSAVQTSRAAPPKPVMPPKPSERQVSARSGDHVEAGQPLSARSENVPEARPFRLPAVTRIEPRETRGAGEDPSAIIDWLVREGAHRER